MKRVIKFDLNTQHELKLTKKDIIALQNIFKGDITQITCSNNLCNNCESRNAGKEYCDGCKKDDFNMFAISQD